MNRDNDNDNPRAHGSHRMRWTSLAAYHSIPDSVLKENATRILDAIELSGGATCYEVECSTGIKNTTVRPLVHLLAGLSKTRRIPALIEDSGRTRRTDTGRPAIVWVVKDYTPRSFGEQRSLLPGGA